MLDQKLFQKKSEIFRKQIFLLYLSLNSNFTTLDFITLAPFLAQIQSYFKEFLDIIIQLILVDFLSQSLSLLTMEKESLQLADFSMLSLIGVGNYAKVVLVRKKSSGKLYAMKIMKKRFSEFQGKDTKFLKGQAFIEKEILNQCNHPFIIKIHGTFQHNRKIYYILQYCPGGELFGILKRNMRLSEQSTKFYAAQVFLALEHLHSQNYLYRDLKPENILIDKQGYVRLVDFGLSCYLKHQKQDNISKISGTPEYLPPEVFNKNELISTSIDWWCFGALIFQMTVGFPPFYKQNQSIWQMKEKIIKDNKFLNYINNPILKDLLEKLMNKDPQKRLGYRGSRQIKNHPWFSNVCWDKLVKKELRASFVPEFKTQQDTRWFDMQSEYSLTPPQNSAEIQKTAGQKYNSFSLSWKSSKSPPIHEDASPVEEIEIKIQQSGAKIDKIEI